MKNIVLKAPGYPTPHRKLMLALVAVGILSSTAHAGTCEIVVVPKFNLENPQSDTGILPPLFLRRKIELQEVSVEECVESAAAELNFDFHFIKDRFEVQKAKYRFTEGDVRVTGKVKLSDLAKDASK